MTPLPTVVFSKTNAELIQQIGDIHNQLAAFYRSIPADRMMVDAEPRGWPAFKNIKHSASINKVFAFYVGLPVWLLRLRGKPRRPNVTLDILVPTNRPQITDHGSYPKGEPIDSNRLNTLLVELLRSSEKLKKSVETKTNEELDTLQSLFGGMTLRMFVHFLLKHNLYHASVVRYRIENM
ncbi:MAG: hypothetical protein H3C43_06225 [Leptonema sp. (in: Bacteria)]|nr:hypothetical protein [Leptonema sp. (in: bacteria)]